MGCFRGVSLIASLVYLAYVLLCLVTVTISLLPDFADVLQRVKGRLRVNFVRICFQSVPTDTVHILLNYLVFVLPLFFFSVAKVWQCLQSGK